MGKHLKHKSLFDTFGQATFVYWHKLQNDNYESIIIYWLIYVENAILINLEIPNVSIPYAIHVWNIYLHEQLIFIR